MIRRWDENDNVFLASNVLVFLEYFGKIFGNTDGFE